MRNDGLTPGKRKAPSRKVKDAQKAQEGPGLFDHLHGDNPPLASPATHSVIDFLDKPKPDIYPDMQPQRTIQCGPLCPWIYYPVPSPNSFHLPAGCPKCIAISPSLCIVDDGGFCWAHGKEHVSVLDLMDEMMGGGV